MNPKSEWFKRNTQSELIRRIPTSNSWGLKDWSGFIRIQSLGLTWIETDWFLTELHQTRLKTFFGLTRMSLDCCGNRFRNKSDLLGMNFNPKPLPGSACRPRPRVHAAFLHLQCANRPFWPLVSKYTIFNTRRKTVYFQASKAGCELLFFHQWENRVKKLITEKNNW